MAIIECLISYLMYDQYVQSIHIEVITNVLADQQPLNQYSQ